MTSALHRRKLEEKAAREIEQHADFYHSIAIDMKDAGMHRMAELMKHREIALREGASIIRAMHLVRDQHRADIMLRKPLEV